MFGNYNQQEQEQDQQIDDIDLVAMQQQLLQQQQRRLREKVQQQQQEQGPARLVLTFQEDCNPGDPSSHTIPVYKIDNEESLENRLIHTINLDPGMIPHWSSFFIFKNPLLKTMRFVDLFNVFTKQVPLRFELPTANPVKRPLMRRPGGVAAGGGGGGGAMAVPLGRAAMPPPPLVHPLVLIYRCLMDAGYKISVSDFLRLYMVHFLVSNFPLLLQEPHRRAIDLRTQRAPQILHVTVIDNLNKYDILRALGSNEIPSKMKTKWTMPYIEEELRKIKNLHDDRMEVFRASELLREEYNRIGNLPGEDCGPLNINGNIISFSVRTVETTGILFDRLRLRPEAPLARYKDFYKIFAPLGEFEGISLDESIKEGGSSALVVVNNQGGIIAHIINTAEGVNVQGMLKKDMSGWSNKEDLVSFLGFDDTPVVDRSDLGITVQFVIRTRKIPLDPSIFSNLCMNDALFRTFFQVNDSARLSKDNLSVYLYYTMQAAKKKKSRLEQELRIHGWSKHSSRFGDVSATLSPIHLEKGEFAINVNVTRAANQALVAMFRETLCKMIYRYTTLFDEQIALFRRYIMDQEWISPVVSLPPSTRGIADPVRGPFLDPRIFGGIHDWSTICQIPKENKNIVVIDAETASKKSEESWMKFPPASYKGIDPAYYYCPDDTYKVINLVKLDSITHPFGYAPCCTKKSHKVFEEMKAAVEYHIEKGYMPYFTQPISLREEMKNELTVLKYDNKLMRFIGQLGTPAPKVDQLMTALMPGLEFLRQSGSNWRFDSLLGCLEFHRAISTADMMMRSPQDIRQQLLSQTKTFLDVGAQQNFDIGVDGLRAMLLKWDENLSADRWIRILEEFFDVNMFVFTQNNRIIDFMRPRCYREFIFPFKNILGSRKIVFLMEHTSGTTNLILRYELIVGRNEQQQLLHDFDCYEQYFMLLEKAYSTFVGSKKTFIPFFLPRQQSQKTASPCLPSHQILDCYGKLRVVVYKNSFPAILFTAQAPWNLGIWNTQAAVLPSYTQITQFLQNERLDIKKTYLYKGGIAVLVVEDFIRLYFLATVDDTMSEPSRDTLPIYITGVVDMILMLLNPQDTYGGTDMLITENNQRLVNVLRDLCVLRFSLFMKSNIASMTMQTIPNLIREFLQTEIEFSDDVRIQISDLHPRMTNNPSLQTAGGKMILPRILETKLTYCLQWYSITKTKEFEMFPSLVESPSYFISVTNFTHHPLMILQKSLQPFHNRPYDVACQDPIDRLPDIVTINRLFFFYRPEESPLPIPYLAFLSSDRKQGMEMASHYINTRTWQITPPTTREQLSRPPPFAERRLIQGKYHWVQAQLETPIFYLATIANSAHLLFLLPLSKKK